MAVAVRMVAGAVNNGLDAADEVVVSSRPGDLVDVEDDEDDDDRSGGDGDGEGNDGKGDGNGGEGTPTPTDNEGIDTPTPSPLTPSLLTPLFRVRVLETGFCLSLI
ncbi:MAG: hypothetical protein OXI97_15355 [Acidimicrobiaceae bacterium]|nr:hypothetical protein [Acidimicrobiaceae bacterium]